MAVTREIEATGCKITDSSEVGITDEDGQATIDQISGTDGRGVTITHSRDKTLTTNNSTDNMAPTSGVTDRNDAALTKDHSF